MNCARNIITANFGGGTSATTAPLWQWDYGQVLCITGIEDLPAVFEVHFSTNRTGGVSTTAVGADGQVTIPNVLLTIGKNINAWIYLSDSEGEGETEYSILIPVKARPMPETYDAEVTGEFDDVVRRVSEYAETAQTAADNAGASATAAATSASEAAASASAAESAKTAAETAQGKAEDAQAAAETAAQTATEKAQQSAQDAAHAALDAGRAESAAGRAEAAETGAESAKTDAETAAQGAAASASAASASASSAGQAATSAAQSATAAAGSATTAGNAAQTATTKAGEASASASAAAASETAAQTAQTAAETAATNAGQSASTATAKAAESAQSASGAAQSKTDAEAAAARAEQAAASLTVDTALSDTSTNPVQNKVVTAELTNVKSAIDALKIVDTASGAIASFPDGAAMPMEGLTVELEPIQDLHGQSNPYPAGGGVNKFDKDAAVVGKWLDVNTGVERNTSMNYVLSDWIPVRSGMTYAFTNPRSSRCWAYDVSKNPLAAISNPYTATADGYIRITVSIVDVSLDTFMVVEGSTLPSTYAPYENICPITGRDSVTVTRTGVNLFDEQLEVGGIDDSTGAKNAVSTQRRSVNYIPVKPNINYYVYVEGIGTGGLYAYYYSFDKSFIGRAQYGSSYNMANRTLTTPDNCYFIMFKAQVTGGNWDEVKISINYPSTDHDYHAYDGASVTVQLGQTVYGGNAEIISGQGENTMGMVDLGTLNWTYQASSGTNLQRFVSSGIADSVSRKATQDGCMLDMVCSIYKPSSKPVYTRTEDATICVLAQTGVLYVCDSRFTDAASFKAAMSGVQLCYKLATPQTLTLTPASLSTLKGTNNVWSDADTVSVDYVADPKLYIARLTEPDADMVADANITSGSYFMVNNTLYLATANIASGANIVPGVNCNRTNLASALNAINA